MFDGPVLTRFAGLKFRPGLLFDGLSLTRHYKNDVLVNDVFVQKMATANHF